MTAEPFIIAGSLFLITKVAVSFVGWFLGEEGDSFARQRLDGLWEKLESHTFPLLLHEVLARFVRRIRETLLSSKRALIWLVVVAFVVNLFSVFLAIPLMTFLEEHSSAYAGSYNRTFPETVLGWWRGTLGVPLWSVAPLFGPTILGTVFDGASAYVTWLLIRKAAAARSLKAAFSHLFMDVAVAIASCCWAAFALIFFIGSVDLDISTSILWTLEYLATEEFPAIIHAEWSAEHIAYAVLGISAAIPTVAYSVLLILCILAHLTPRWLHRFSTRCVFLVTTEKTPVFGRVGTVLGGLAATAGAIAKL